MTRSGLGIEPLRIWCRRMRTITGLDELRDAKGETLGTSDWHEVTQEAIDAFADVTGDHQWIHVDRERAKQTPFGGTIAHGYYTLSLAPMFNEQIFGLEGFAFAVNYGLNRVRFPAPLPVDSRVRMHAKLKSLEEVPGGAQMTLECTFEVEGGDKPVCVAETGCRDVDLEPAPARTALDLHARALARRHHVTREPGDHRHARDDRDRSPALRRRRQRRRAARLDRREVGPRVVEAEAGTQRRSVHAGHTGGADDVRGHDARRRAALDDLDALEAAADEPGQLPPGRAVAHPDRAPAVLRRDAVVLVLYGLQPGDGRVAERRVLDVLRAAARGREEVG